ncbi:MAG: ferredoxin reductase family protein, partial [Janthinobacterium lividum]
MTALLSPTAIDPDRPWARLDDDAALDRTVRTVTAVLLWAGLLLVTYWWDVDRGISDLRAWATGLTSAGRLTGLWSADLLLVQVLLMSRLPPLEHAFGRDRLARIHRVVGFLSFDLMCVHVVTIVLGYAGASWLRVPATTWDLVTTYGGVLLSVAGTVCLVMVVVTSVKKARRRLRYESWHLLHLYAYLGVGLALPHQLWTGQEFLQSPTRTLYWWGLWIAAATSVLVWRVLLPLVRSLRHGLRVTSVVRESSDVVSVYLTGRRLDRLPLRAGQFLNVRFLDGPGWTRSNPFSLSAAPDGRSVRITAKALGDGSSRLARLRPGTRAVFEGPYGRLTSRARTRPRVLLIGAGVGVTPVRALAEGLAYAPGDAVLLQRCTAEPLFVAELDVLGRERGLRSFVLA